MVKKFGILDRSTTLSELHALIIDDNSTNLDVISYLLQAEDIQATVVQNLENLEDILNTLDRIDVVFLDLEMPEADGYEILTFLTETVRISAPIVAYTVHVSEINTARKLGFHSFIGKPLQADRFPSQITRILNGEPVWEIPDR